MGRRHAAPHLTPPTVAPRARPVIVDRATFESLVSSAIDEVPEPFARALAGVPVIVVDHPPPDEPDVFGMYIGVPLDEPYAADGHLPAHIEIYRFPLMESCDSLEKLRDEVRITVLHELGHHLGFDEDDLERLGIA